MFARSAAGLMICLFAAPAAARDAPTPARPSNPSIVATCAAPAPPVGSRFSGPVLQVLEDDRLCVAVGPSPDQWIAVRLADLGALELMPRGQARAVMMAATFTQRLDCIAGEMAADAVSAVCTIEGAPVADGIRAISVSTDWQAWR